MGLPEPAWRETRRRRRRSILSQEASEGDLPGETAAGTINYPKTDELEVALKAMAAQAGDISDRPVRVDLLRPMRGSPAPLYTVVLLSENRARLCDKLSVVLERQFSLGTRSFLLRPHEASRLMLTSLSSRGTGTISAIGRDSESSS